MGRSTAGKMGSKTKHASRHVKHKSTAAAPIRVKTIEEHLYQSQHYGADPDTMDIDIPTMSNKELSDHSPTSTDVVMYDAPSSTETIKKALTKAPKPPVKENFRHSLLSDKQKPTRSQSDESMRR